MHGNWNDILVNMNWTHKDDGFFKIWVNDKLSYHYKGPTKTKNDKPYFKFGIYRSHLSKWIKKNKKSEVPAQVVYFDEVRVGKEKKDVVGNLPLHEYKEKIEPEASDVEYIALIKNKTDDSVLIKVRAASQELAIEEAMKKCTEKHEEGCYVHYSNQVGFGQ